MSFPDHKFWVQFSQNGLRITAGKTMTNANATTTANDRLGSFMVSDGDDENVQLSLVTGICISGNSSQVVLVVSSRARAVCEKFKSITQINGVV